MATVKICLRCGRDGALVIVGQLSVQMDVATRAAPDGCNMIV